MKTLSSLVTYRDNGYSHGKISVLLCMIRRIIMHSKNYGKIPVLSLVAQKNPAPSRPWPPLSNRLLLLTPPTTAKAFPSESVICPNSTSSSLPTMPIGSIA